jgi:glycosyltransferase involved in cell wall biosynthesis
MRILVIADFIPMPDRASGDLRFSTLLGLFSNHHEVKLCPIKSGAQIGNIGNTPYEAYCRQLEDKGVTVANPLLPLLRGGKWDMVIFEFYQPARALLDTVRFHQPTARVLIDSVDVHFRRFSAKADLTGNPADLKYAEQVRKQELEIYARSDMVLVVTDDDRQILHTLLPDLPLFVLPNVHEIFPPADTSLANANSMLFVGGFWHEPNVDAMLYFCRDVLPKIKAQVPDAHLTIVGSSPPASIQELSSDFIQVTGFVPDTAPFLTKSLVSVAPLRYGAGMKGKIGEALAHGLPVVTTSVGAEGFGLTPDEDILVGDTAEDFARHVVHLFQDRELHERIRLAGWEFIRSRYSMEAVAKMCTELITQTKALPISRLPAQKRLRLALSDSYQKHIAWRF